jgi:hypothetical protein
MGEACFRLNIEADGEGTGRALVHVNACVIHEKRQITSGGTNPLLWMRWACRCQPVAIRLCILACCCTVVGGRTSETTLYDAGLERFGSGDHHAAITFFQVFVSLACARAQAFEPTLSLRSLVHIPVADSGFLCRPDHLDQPLSDVPIGIKLTARA